MENLQIWKRLFLYKSQSYKNGLVRIKKGCYYETVLGNVTENDTENGFNKFPIV